MTYLNMFVKFCLRAHIEGVLLLPHSVEKLVSCYHVATSVYHPPPDLLCHEKNIIKCIVILSPTGLTSLLAQELHSLIKTLVQIGRYGGRSLRVAYIALGHCETI